MRTCSAEGCSRKHHAMGLCRPCYKKVHYYGKEIPMTAKTCAWCGKTFFGKAKSIRRSKDYFYYQVPCFTEYKKTLEEVVALCKR